MGGRRERIATQVLAAMAPDNDPPIAACAAVRYADALITAMGEPEASGVVCDSASYKHPATGRDFYLTRDGAGGYSWIARDGSKTLDTGSAATECEAIAQAVAAVEAK